MPISRVRILDKRRAPYSMAEAMISALNNKGCTFTSPFSYFVGFEEFGVPVTDSMFYVSTRLIRQDLVDYMALYPIDDDDQATIYFAFNMSKGAVLGQAILIGTKKDEQHLARHGLIINSDGCAEFADSGKELVDFCRREPETQEGDDEDTILMDD